MPAKGVVVDTGTGELPPVVRVLVVLPLMPKNGPPMVALTVVGVVVEPT